MNDKSITNEEITFTVNAKELNGIISFPYSGSPCPGIILLHGSDRSSMNDPYYVKHAEKLISSGFAVLRYNGPGWTSETLESRTEEALAIVKYLQSRPEIKSDAVGLWGISQGGWICQMAAAAYDGVAFIIPVSGPGVTPAEQEVYRVEAESRAADFDEDEIAKAVLIRRLMVDIVLSEPIYQEINQSEAQRLGDGPWSEMTELAYRSNPVDLVAEFEKIVEILNTIMAERWTRSLQLDEVLSMFSNFPPQAWGTVKTQMRAVMEINPADFLTKVHCPVLAIFGENDTSIPVEKSAALYKQYLGEAGNNALTIKVFPNASHTIRVDGTFAAGYFDLILDWLDKLPLN
jgi:dipeptidyl aminopeptidase/acylaminoacyl peptidase